MNTSLAAPLLTIAIPTYNRSTHLDFLLSVLRSELQGLKGRIAVFVSDNASTDDTPAVAQKYLALIPGLSYHRNDENRGADFNISACFSRPDTSYVWIVGDDDAPLEGGVARLLDLLERRRPDIVYLPSIGTRSISDDHCKYNVSQCSAVDLNRDGFALLVNVQFTFISGLVFRKHAASLSSIDQALETTRGTSLIQLAWAYEILKQGQRFCIVKNAMLMATAGNSGGYAVLEVFLVNHTRLACNLLADRPAALQGILWRTSLCYLPGLIWTIRNGTMGRFQMPARESVQVPTELSRMAGFRLLVLPIWTFRRVWAGLFYQASRVVTRLMRIHDQYVVLRS